MKSFDLHCDTAAVCLDKHCGLRTNDLDISLERTQGFERFAQVFAVWIQDEFRGEPAYERFCAVAGNFKEELRKNADVISLCRSGAEILAAGEHSKNTAVLSIEGGAAIAGSMQRLHDVYDAGVRLMTLTWNGGNEIADGCMVPGAGGLTPFGLDAVREMNRLRMIVDVSHLSEPGFWDVARVSSRPFIATHSDSKALCGHERNLTDDQFREIVKDGGLVGLNFYVNFLGGKRDMDEILNHAERFLNLGGEKAVALGSDFDGCELCGGITGVQDLPKLYDAMLERFGRRLTDDIFFNNAYRFFTENI